MTKSEALEELLETLAAGDHDLLRPWRDKANKCWKVSVVDLMGNEPTVIVKDSEIPRLHLARLLSAIGEI